MESCPICHSPYGKRKRCYVCHPPKRKTGETKNCLECGKEFYLEQNELKDPRRKGGIYCSRKCHHAAMKGKPNWKRLPLGSKTTRQDGYILIKIAETGNFLIDWQLEHRNVMEQYLRRKLETAETVHHINKIKNDNRVENLQILSNPDHVKRHPTPRKRVMITCQECGKEFETWPYRLNQEDETYNRKYCSLACKNKAWGKTMTAKRLAKATT